MPLEAELQASEAYSPLQRMRYSAALVMAAEVQEMFPGARFGSGRAIEDGFYYDFELQHPLTPGDFPEIEQRMQRIIAGKYPFVRDHWSRLRALEYFRSTGQLYKVELIENLPEEQVSAYQQQNDFPELCRVQESRNWPGEVMICQQQHFLDLCSGQLVEHTGQIGPIKLMSVGGAYWRGDEKRPMLQRLYGTAWQSDDELKAYLERLEEARRRDHRKLGKDLELFMISEEVGAGLPLWLPKGATVRRLLEEYILAKEREQGYQHVYTPQLAKLDLYKTSGHWQHYQDSMYPPMKMESGEELVLRPMNCPHHIQIYKSTTRSYRDLPIRFAELGTVYRLEG